MWLKPGSQYVGVLFIVPVMIRLVSLRSSTLLLSIRGYCADVWSVDADVFQEVPVNFFRM